MTNTPNNPDESLPELTIDYLRSKSIGEDQSAEKVADALAEKVIQQHFNTLSAMSDQHNGFFGTFNTKLNVLCNDFSESSVAVLSHYIEYLGQEEKQYESVRKMAKSGRCASLSLGIKRAIEKLAQSSASSDVSPESARILLTLLHRAPMVETAKIESQEATSSAPDKDGATIVDIPHDAPVARQRAQENDILRVIKTLGYNNHKLPKWKRGSTGVKALVRNELQYSTKTFDLAWERLRKSEDIKDDLSPSN